jgi:hypothetical protein
MLLNSSRCPKAIQNMSDDLKQQLMTAIENVVGAKPCTILPNGKSGFVVLSNPVKRNGPKKKKAIKTKKRFRSKSGYKRKKYKRRYRRY